MRLFFAEVFDEILPELRERPEICRKAVYFAGTSKTICQMFDDFCKQWIKQRGTKAGMLVA